MTVSSEANKIVYNGNGSTTVFTFPFATPDANSIKVIIQDTQGNISVQSPGAYSVTLNPLVGVNPTPTGGSVIYPVAGAPLPVGAKIAIIRELDPIQPVSLTNQSIMYPPVIEKEFDYLTMLFQHGEEVASRAFTANILDPVPTPTAPVAERANHFVYFDANGDLVAGGTPSGTVFISAAMIPVVGAPTLSDARVAMGIRSTKTVTTTYGVSSADNGIFFNLIGAAFYQVSLGPATGFPPDFVFFLNNNDTRGKLIVIDGYSSFILWPTQSAIVSQNGAGTAWIFTRSGRWRSMANIVFNVDFANGNDSGDGLSTGSQAFKTIQYAVNTLENECDGNFSIKLADGTHNVGAGITCSKPLIGSSGYSIIGNTVTPDSVIVSGTSGSTFRVQNNAVLTIQGIRFQNTNGTCLSAYTGSVVNISNVRFGFAINGAHIWVQDNATVNINGPIKVLGGNNAGYHIIIQLAGYVSYYPGVVTFEGSCTFTVAFLSCQYSSAAGSGGVTYVGAGFVTGKQYDLGYNSVAQGFGTLPGTVPGTATTGSFYV